MGKKLLVPLLVLFFVGCGGILKSELVSESSSGDRPYQLGELRKFSFHDSYIMRKDFFEEAYAGVEPRVESRKIQGVIAPHHLLAAHNMANLFGRLEGQEVKTVVIVGPNHFETGSYPILISEVAYVTPYGLLEPDLAVIEQLVQSGVVKHEEKPFEEEHAISTLVTFVKKTFPAARVVAVILKNDVSPEAAAQLGLKLDEFLPAESLFLASLDFAHHVDYETAVKFDQESLRVINDFDFWKVAEMEVDSPMTVYALFTFLQAREMEQFVLVENTNAAEILGNLDFQDVTSHILGYFVAD